LSVKRGGNEEHRIAQERKDQDARYVSRLVGGSVFGRTRDVADDVVIYRNEACESAKLHTFTDAHVPSLHFLAAE
jgi:hypothetical protein